MATAFVLLLAWLAGCDSPTEARFKALEECRKQTVISYEQAVRDRLIHFNISVCAWDVGKAATPAAEDLTDLVIVISKEDLERMVRR